MILSMILTFFLSLFQYLLSKFKKPEDIWFYDIPGFMLKYLIGIEQHKAKVLSKLQIPKGQF